MALHLRTASVLAAGLVPLALALPARAEVQAHTQAQAQATGPAPAQAPARATAPAQARATASVNPNGWKLTYRAASGQTNRVTASVAWNEARTRLVYLIDDSVPVRAGNGCDYPIEADRTSVRCEVEPVDSQDPYATLTMNLRDQNDTVEFHNDSTQVYYFNQFWLGSGQDTLDSSDAETSDGSFVWGQSGPDRITTGAVATAQGGSGPDTLTTSGNYSDLDGGAGNDKVWGGVGTQFLRGGSGDDVVHGGAGKDRLYGGPGDDRLYGEQNADSLYGHDGDDYLNGGKGTDKLNGGPGQDTVRRLPSDVARSWRTVPHATH